MKAKFWMVSLAVVAVLSFSCSSKSTNPGGASSAGNNVSARDNVFSPVSKTVAAGTTITWTNNGPYNIHTVTSDTGTFLNSFNIPVGGTYSKTFGGTGSFYYHCEHHGLPGSGGNLGSGMAGVVIVQ